MRKTHLQRLATSLAVVMVETLTCSPQSLMAHDAKPDGIVIATVKNWTIVVAADASARQNYAAKEFQTFFKRTTAAQLPVRTTGGPNGGSIFIGQSASLRESSIGSVLDVEYATEELRIVVTKDNIAIVGGQRGLLYGVYTFLEDYLGVRFLTAEITHTPKATNKQQIPIIDRRYKPPFDYRFYLKSEVMSDPAFAARRRQNAASAHGPPEHRLGEHLGGEATGGVFLHNNFLLHAPGADHPEYYALRDGKRTSQQPCLTHPEVRRIVTNGILASLDGYKPGTTIPLAQNDNGGFCQCRRCAAVQREGDSPESIEVPEKPLGISPADLRDGPPSAVIVDFVNHVAEAVSRKRPDLWIGTEAYAYSTIPPRKTRVHKNVKVQIASYHCAVLYPFDDARSPNNRLFLTYLSGWRRACDHILFWAYDYNPREYWLPFPNLRSQPAHIRTFVKNNGRGLFLQGVGQNAELSDMRAYVMTALLWHPMKDADALRREFLQHFYGEAWEPIENWINIVHDQAVASGSESNINAPARAYGLDAELGERGLELFQQALDRADNPAIRDRVEKASITALRLALEPVCWNAIEAPVRTRILKTKLPDERVVIEEADLPRYRQMAKQLFALAKKHKLQMYSGGRRAEDARKAVFEYLALGDTPADAQGDAQQ